MKNAATQQVEFGAAVGLPLEQFQPVDLAFDGTIAPRLRQGGPNRRKVADNSGNEAMQRRGSRRGQPNLERRRIPLAQNGPLAASVRKFTVRPQRRRVRQ